MIQPSVQIPIDLPQIISRDITAKVREFDTLTFSRTASFALHPATKNPSGNKFQSFQPGNQFGRKQLGGGSGHRRLVLTSRNKHAAAQCAWRRSGFENGRSGNSFFLFRRPVLRRFFPAIRSAAGFLGEKRHPWRSYFRPVVHCNDSVLNCRSGQTSPGDSTLPVPPVCWQRNVIPVVGDSQG